MMMEKHRCKLCFRSFSNGRALGGHMRSHMMHLPLPPKPNESPPPPPATIQLSFEAESASSPSSSFEENNNKGSLSYGLREKPKRNFRFSDPEFFDAGSVILHDRESESESSRNLTRKRSKRTRKIESTSSASDTSTEEDVAFCLMMLSRDKWKRQHHELVHDDEDEDDEDDEEEEEEEEDDSDEDDESEEEEVKVSTKKVRGRYKCETCDKTFRSYQALGGHRASHKKIKVVKEEEHEIENKNSVVEKKIHECPVCFRIFGSGQALGGHKRTHVTGSAAVTVAANAEVRVVPVPSSPKFGDSLIDLNLPAPLDEDDVSQIDDSAVSDAEFVKFS